MSANFKKILAVSIVTAQLAGVFGVFRVTHASNGGGNVPIVSTAAATNVSQTSAILNGSVNPNGSLTNYHFIYGTSENNMVLGTPSLSAGTGSAALNVSAQIFNLQPNTTYFFRIVAQNQFGSAQGAIQQFVTGSFGSPTLRVSPSTKTLDVGQAFFFAALHDADGPGPMGEVTVNAQWTSGSGSIVAHQGGGNFLGIAAGTATITATYQGLAAQATVVVSQSGGAPTAQTQAATNVSLNSATANALVNPNGAQTTVYFEYGTTQSLGQTAGNQSIGSGTTAFTVQGGLSSLQQNTTYYFRIVAQNSFGTTHGQILSFTTTGQFGGGTGGAPVAFTQSATNLSGNSVNLNGSVNPNNASTNVYFEYGLTQFLGQTTGAQTLGAANFTQNVSAYIGNLQPNTTYYFRVVAQNSFGTSPGAILNFYTGGYGSGGPFYGGTQAPGVFTQPASNIGQYSATLNGAANPNTTYGYSYSYGYPYTFGNYPYTGNVNVYFEYGTTQYFGQSTGFQSVSPGSYTQNVSAYVGNLQPNTTYYFRVVAQTPQFGTTYGNTLTFTTTGSGQYYGGYAGGTSGLVPTLNTNAATNIGQTSATLRGSVNPNNNLTVVWFEYGRTRDLGQSIGYQSVGSGNYASDVSSNLSNLVSGTAYYYRLAAQNGYGTSYGAIATFRTLGEPAAAYNGSAAPARTEPAVANVSLTPAVDKSQPIQPSVDISRPNPGDYINYTLAYKNSGNAAITGLVLTVVFPGDAIEYVSAQPAPSSVNPNGLTFILGNLKANGEGVVAIKLRVKPDAKPGTPLTFVAILNYVDPARAPQSVMANLTIQVSDAASAVLGATAVGALSGGSLLLSLLVLLIVLVAAHFAYSFVKDRQAAREEAYIAPTPAASAPAQRTYTASGGNGPAAGNSGGYANRY